jgi:ribulose-phosphate 3-epimerase
MSNSHVTPARALGPANRADRLASVWNAPHPTIVPSLLSCDFARIKDEIQSIESAGATMLHLDVMDGHFVPNISFGPPVIECIRRVTDLPLDTHLMISEPGKYLDAFAKAGCDSLTVHIEVREDPRRLLDEIHRHGCRAGISLNPPTPVATLRECVKDADLILVMSVMPGFGGQAFDDSTLAKVAEIRAMARPESLIEMDGGINRQTIALTAMAGAQLLVAGSAIFRAEDYSVEFSELSRLAGQAAGKSRSAL